MIERILFDFLRGELGIPVLAERPASGQVPPYIVVDRTGEVLINHVHTVTFAADCYAASMLEAAELCDTFVQAVLSAVWLPEIGSTRLQTTYNNTRTDTKEHRYKAVFTVTYVRGGLSND